MIVEGVKNSNARVWAGWDKGIYLKLRRLAREAGNAGGQKEKGVWGEMNFCPPVVPQSGTEGGKRFRNSALAEYQNRKIFVSLIEKNFGGAQLKNAKKIFLFCSPSGGRKRWAGLSPAGRQLKVSIGILFKVGSNFRLSGQKLFLDFKNPFKILAEAEPERSEGEAISSQNSEIVKWRCVFEKIRTDFINGLDGRNSPRTPLPPASPKGGSGKDDFKFFAGDSPQGKS